MAIIKGSSRHLYVDKSRDSKETIRFLQSVGVEFTVVDVAHPRSDPRKFRKLPTLTLFTRGGYVIHLNGLGEIKQAERLIRFDHEQESEERRRIRNGELRKSPSTAP